MQVQRPKFIDIDFQAGDEIPEQFDVVQVKLDGRWVCLEVRDGSAVGYSRTGREMFRVAVHPQLTGFTLIGEYIYGTQWAAKSGMHCALGMFDLVEAAGQDVRHAPLSKRSVWLEQVVELLKPYFVDIATVATHAVASIPTLWEEGVVGQGWEGLVLKDSQAAYGEPWGRMKAIDTADYQLMSVDCNETGSVVLVGRSDDGEVVRVQVHDRSLRDAIYEDFEQGEETLYLGRWFEVSHAGVTESGGLRHPQFVCWREEK